MNRRLQRNQALNLPAAYEALQARRAKLPSFLEIGIERCGLAGVVTGMAAVTLKEGLLTSSLVGTALGTVGLAIGGGAICGIGVLGANSVRKAVTEKNFKDGKLHKDRAVVREARRMAQKAQSGMAF
jgi:hypothetical protein